MAVDNRPFKSKEQDGQGNEIIIRDQQLVEQGTETTMASGACFETRDVDDRPVKIPRDNMMNIVLECIGIILNDSSRNLGTNVQKALGLQGNTVGHSTVANFASVLGVKVQSLRSDVALDDVKYPGFHCGTYYANNATPEALNFPENNRYMFLFSSFITDGSTGIQIVLSYTTGKNYIRNYWGGFLYSGWKEI